MDIQGIMDIVSSQPQYWPTLRTNIKDGGGHIYDDSTVYFPPLSRVLQRYRNWWELDMVSGHTRQEKYETLFALGKIVRPYLIAEIGCGFGHSLMALAMGAQAAGQPNVTVNGYDPETETPGCVEWAREWFMQNRIPYNLSHSSSRQYDKSGIPLKHIDLFHVDGSPIETEVIADINLAIDTLSPRGVIVISSNPGIAAHFTGHGGWSAIQLPKIAVMERV